MTDKEEKALTLIAQQGGSYIMRWTEIHALADQVQYEDALRDGQALTDLANKVEAQKDEILKPLNLVRKRWLERYNAAARPIEAARSHIKRLLASFIEAEQAKATKTANKEIKAALKAGNTEYAEDIRASACAQAFAPLGAPGLSLRTSWTATLVDPRAFLAAILDNRVDLELIDWEGTLRKLSALARIRKTESDIPGVIFKSTQTLGLGGNV